MGVKQEEILANGKYKKHDTWLSGNDGEVWTISGGKQEEEDRVYTYDEAIELTGNGWYNIGLLVTLVLAIQGMALDMFGFSYVAIAARCDLQLTQTQTSFLLSVPLLGPIVSAYPHGYLTDTQGRKKCLGFVLWGSFVVASLSALSPNFTVLAVFKFISSAICSGVQSIAFTLLGECSRARHKDRNMVILSSFFISSYAVFTTLAYLVLGLEFTYDLGFITFKPWRLLILTLATYLGFSALFVSFFYESPKFLINAGRTSEALEVLRKIKMRNIGDENYPVKKMILLESTTSLNPDASFLRSLLDQTLPVFKPPLLQRTLLLFYITAGIYSVNNGFYLWIPVVTRAFFEQSSNVTEDFCTLLNSLPPQTESDNCRSEVSLETLLLSIVIGGANLVINCGVTVVAHKKKMMIIFITLLNCFCCLALIFITERFATIAAFFGVQTDCFCMGLVFCYFVDLYPTRHRGMITCLGVMMARVSGAIGVQLVGAYAFTHCTGSLYTLGAYIFSGALAALLLPPDTPKKT